MEFQIAVTQRINNGYKWININVWHPVTPIQKYLNLDIRYYPYYMT